MLIINNKYRDRGNAAKPSDPYSHHGYSNSAAMMGAYYKDSAL